MSSEIVPRILIIDDLFGRTHTDRRNEERANLCGQYLVEDITGDEIGKGTSQKIKTPVAQAVFYRGQSPVCVTVGDTVENDLESTLRIIREGWDERSRTRPRWAMVLLDLCFYTGRVTEESDRRTLGMPAGREGDDDPKQYFGLTILQAIHYEFPDLPVIILSSKSREEVSRDFAYRGALGFLPREDSQSPELLKKFIRRDRLVPDDTGGIVGDSKPMLLALRTSRRAALNSQNVLIRGDRGSGKELIARYIHSQSRKNSAGPFVAINSAALLPTLYASELFGIEKRVASGVEGRDGLIKGANGGDLFFDEIGDMLPETQSGILRVLEYREVTPVGSKVSYPVDVRFISATNVDIESKAASGSFRSDLLDRLREGGTILLPPLRDRLEDIPLLVGQFVREAEGENPLAMKRNIEPESLEKILTYSWPGNVRQLRSCIFSAVNNHPDVEHLVPVHIQIPLADHVREDTGRHHSVASEASGQKEPVMADGLDDLVRALDACTFDTVRRELLVGRLQQIENAYARLLARYLKATLDATSQATPDNPAGKIRIHPAIKLIKGDSNLSASKAADTIKQLLGICPEAIGDLLEDPTLKDAYDTALRLRPRKQKPRREVKPE